MSSITIATLQLLVLISHTTIFHQTMAALRQCDLSSAIHLQSATYTHSIIVRVQPISSSKSEWKENEPLLRQVLIREVIKDSNAYYSPFRAPLQSNDLVIIRIHDQYQQAVLLQDSCWNLLEVTTIEIILFLNQTQTDQFDLNYPPVESTIRVRQNIEAVLNYETYPPQVLIKPRLDRAILSQEYSLQCNSRGNPLPRLIWSKQLDLNQTFEYYPSAKQCHTSCRIYSIQNKYQSILYFRFLELGDIGIYVCHAENPMNRTSTNIYLEIDSPTKNITCANLKYCHYHGQCVLIDDQLKCLCDNRYFGELCETNYDDIVKKQDNAILLFKSRFLAGFILALIGFLLLLIACLSWYLARHSRSQTNKIQVKNVETKKGKTTATPSNGNIKSAVKAIAKDNTTKTEENGRLPTSSPIELISKELLSSTPTSIRVSRSSISENQPTITHATAIRRPQGATTFTRESSTATEDDEDSIGFNGLMRHYQSLPPVPNKIDEEYEERFSLQMNKSEELGLSYLANGLPSTDNHAIFYQYEKHRPGLIKPLNIPTEVPAQRYTKYVSSVSKFVLPRPMHS